MRIAAQSSPSMTSPTFLSPWLTPHPLQRRLLPKHPKQTPSSSCSSYTIYRFFLPSTSGSFLSFSSPTLLLLPALAKPQPTPTPRLPHLFSASLILRSKRLFPSRLLSSLNFSFRNLSSHCRQTPPSSDKFAKVRTQWSWRETRRWRTSVRVLPRTRPRVFTRPHPAVTERGNFHFLGIFGVFAAVFFFRDCLPRAGDQTICLYPAK